MNRIFTYMRYSFIAVAALFITSCESEKLTDVIVKDNNLPNVGLALEKLTSITNGDNFSIDINKMTIPVTVSIHCESCL
jgi:hypothetical protein